jgi:hypothetical protein
MSASITVQVPDSINNWTPLLATFFAGMIAKLDKNSHKETPTKESLQEIMDLLIEEICEFETQIHMDRFNDNSFVELMDQANFAFLAYVALRMEHERATSERTR